MAFNNMSSGSKRSILAKADHLSNFVDLEPLKQPTVQTMIEPLQNWRDDKSGDKRIKGTSVWNAAVDAYSKLSAEQKASFNLIDPLTVSADEKNWKMTRRINIFSRQFCIIIVNLENTHYVCVILCYPVRLSIAETTVATAAAPDRPHEPFLLLLDSYYTDNEIISEKMNKFLHASWKQTMKDRMEWLNQDQRSINASWINNLKIIPLKSPHQTDTDACGAYALANCIAAMHDVSNYVLGKPSLLSSVFNTYTVAEAQAEAAKINLSDFKHLKQHLTDFKSEDFNEDLNEKLAKIMVQRGYFGDLKVTSLSDKKSDENDDDVTESPPPAKAQPVKALPRIRTWNEVKKAGGWDTDELVRCVQGEFKITTQPNVCFTAPRDPPLLAEAFVIGSQHTSSLDPLAVALHRYQPGSQPRWVVTATTTLWGELGSKNYSHFLLVVFDAENKIILVCDPMGGKTNPFKPVQLENNDSWLENFNDELNNRLGAAKPKVILFKLGLQIDTSKAWTCGLWSAHIIRRLMKTAMFNDTPIAELPQKIVREINADFGVFQSLAIAVGARTRQATATTETFITTVVDEYWREIGGTSTPAPPVMSANRQPPAAATATSTPPAQQLPKSQAISLPPPAQQKQFPLRPDHDFLPPPHHVVISEFTADDIARASDVRDEIELQGLRVDSRVIDTEFIYFCRAELLTSFAQQVHLLCHNRATPLFQAPEAIIEEGTVIIAPFYLTGRRKNDKSFVLSHHLLAGVVFSASVVAAAGDDKSLNVIVSVRVFDPANERALQQNEREVGSFLKPICDQYSAEQNKRGRSVKFTALDWKNVPLPDILPLADAIQQPDQFIRRENNSALLMICIAQHLIVQACDQWWEADFDWSRFWPQMAKYNETAMKERVREAVSRIASLSEAAPASNIDFIASLNKSIIAAAASPLPPPLHRRPPPPPLILQLPPPPHNPPPSPPLPPLPLLMLMMMIRRFFKTLLSSPQPRKPLHRRPPPLPMLCRHRLPPPPFPSRPCPGLWSLLPPPSLPPPIPSSSLLRSEFENLLYKPRKIFSKNRLKRCQSPKLAKELAVRQSNLKMTPNQSQKPSLHPNTRAWLTRLARQSLALKKRKRRKRQRPICFQRRPI